MKPQPNFSVYNSSPDWLNKLTISPGKAMT